VEKAAGGVTTTYVYDATGNLAAEYSSQPPPMPCQTCYLTTDHLGSTRVITSQTGGLVSRHDFLPFGEELVTTNRTAAQGYGVADNVMQRYTGRQRDLEGPVLDFFGARYFQGAQGRFISRDAKHFTPRTVRFPQKWNRYAFVQNNPLSRIDPDGLDDYKVFIAAPEAAGGDWAHAEQAASANGHTLQLFRDDKATLENYNKALADPNSRVVFMGHSTHAEEGTNGVQLVNGISAGTASQTTDQATSTTYTDVTIRANTVALFACDTTAIMGQYATVDNPKVSIVGVDSGQGLQTSLEGLGAAAAAFVTADALARPANGQPPPNAVDPIAAANIALQQNTHTQDIDGDEIVRHQ
jgi:RHS repeat-associated protein